MAGAGHSEKQTPAEAELPYELNATGRPPKSTAEERRDVYSAAMDGMTLREIAELVFGDPRYKDRVARILRRPPCIYHYPSLEDVGRWLRRAERATPG